MLNMYPLPMDHSGGYKNTQDPEMFPQISCILRVHSQEDWFGYRFATKPGVEVCVQDVTDLLITNIIGIDEFHGEPRRTY